MENENKKSNNTLIHTGDDNEFKKVSEGHNKA